MLKKIKKIIKNPQRIKPIILTRFSRWTNTALPQQVSISTGSRMRIVLPDTLSTVVFFEGDYEPAVTRFLKKYLKPDDVFFDVGAHFGIRSIQAIDITSGRIKIYAFEPGIEQLKTLKYNTNMYAQISIIPKAVSNVSNKILSMKQFNYRFIGSSTLGKPRLPQNLLIQALRNYKIVMVKTITLDDFANKKNIIPSLIKIDVENHEFEVLEGARKVINKHHPKIIIESDNSKSIKLLKSCGYKIIKIDKDNWGAIY